MKNIKTGAWSHDGHWKNGHYTYYMGRGERYANVKYIFSFEKILNRMKCFEMFFLEILEMQCMYMYVITVAYFGSVVSWILEWANSVYYV